MLAREEGDDQDNKTQLQNCIGLAQDSLDKALRIVQRLDGERTLDSQFLIAALSSAVRLAKQTEDIRLLLYKQMMHRLVDQEKLRERTPVKKAQPPEGQLNSDPSAELLLTKRKDNTFYERTSDMPTPGKQLVLNKSFERITDVMPLDSITVNVIENPSTPVPLPAMIDQPPPQATAVSCITPEPAKPAAPKFDTSLKKSESNPLRLTSLTVLDRNLGFDKEKRALLSAAFKKVPPKGHLVESNVQYAAY